MKYTRGQFTAEYYRNWERGSTSFVQDGASVYFIKYRINPSDEYPTVSVRAGSYQDALERACFVVAHSLSLRPEDIDLHSVYDVDGNLLWGDELESDGISRREFLATFGAASAVLLLGFQPRPAAAATASVSLGGTASGFAPFIDDVFSTYTYTGNGVFNAIANDLKLGSTAQWMMYKISHASITQHTDIKTDSSGNIYVSGIKMGTPSKPYLIKYNSSFTSLWHKEINVSYNGTGGRIAIDGTGNVYFATSINRGDGESIGTFFKFDSTGSLLWQRELNTTVNRATSCSGLAVDSNGDIYAVGTSQLSTTSNGYIIKLNSSGTLQWQKLMANTGVTCGQIAIDASNNIYVPMLTHDGSYHAYGVLQKFDSSGTLVWQRAVDFPSYGGGFTGVVLDATGNIYAQGQWNAGGPSGVAIVKYNSSGVLQYKRHLSYGSASYETYSESSLSFATDGTYLYGTVRSNFQAANVGRHTSLFKLNTSDGSSVWQKTFFDSSSDVAFGTTILSSDNARILCGGTSTGGSVSRRGQLIASLPTDNSIVNGKAFFCLSESASMSNSGTQMATINDTSTGIGASTSTHTLGTSSFAVVNASGYSLASETQNTVSGDGGMVWTKSRSAAYHNYIQDTVQGSGVALITNSPTGAASGIVGRSFNANGFTLDRTIPWNEAASTFVSWAFCKAPRFFDVVTYTGNAVVGRQISHSLGVAPGMIVIKATDHSSNWKVWHRSLADSYNMELDSNISATSQSMFGNSSTQTSTYFSLTSAHDHVNSNGATYVAYLFAHDISAEGIIQCGSFTTDGAGNAAVTLGWEPQYVLVKASNTTSNWDVRDIMRGGLDISGLKGLRANISDAELSSLGTAIKPNAIGFDAVYVSGNTYSYLAIRRPNKPPTSATQVFNVILRTGTGTAATVSGVGFAPDLLVQSSRNAQHVTLWLDRLRDINKYLISSSTAAENSGSGGEFTMDGYSTTSFPNYSGSTDVNYFFRRAPGFLDIVCYNAVTNQDVLVPHSLKVVPELIIARARNFTQDWSVFLPNSATRLEYGYLNKNTAFLGGGPYPATTTNFTASNGWNSSGYTYVAYLFATLPGISKVGSYTGNGATQTIGCGFTAGARFILVKRTDSTGDWYVWDTARGISTGANDSHFSFNTGNAEVTTDDSVDPDNAGFIVKQNVSTNINVSGGTYIFLAIA